MTRDQLLDGLRKGGIKVSPSQLRRWVDAGLFPKPVRRGLGRGKGVSVLYPVIAAPQAVAMALALKMTRNLDDVAWTLWLLGFPVTPYIRDLLVEDFRRDQQRIKTTLKALKSKKFSDKLVRAASPGGELSSLGKVIRPERLPRFLEMIAAHQVGQLREHDYTEDDWLIAKEAVLSMMLPDQPDLLDADDMASPHELRDGLARLSREAPIAKAIQALKATSDDTLRDLRSEAEAFVGIVSEALGEKIMLSRDQFRTYFVKAVVAPDGAKERKKILEAMHWVQPPLAPIEAIMKQRLEISKESK